MLYEFIKLIYLYEASLQECIFIGGGKGGAMGL